MDIAGKQIAVLANAVYQNGKHLFELDAATLNLKTGIYFVRLQSEHTDLFEKIILTANQ